jgi:TRAP-type C4-dicarboxylate transport system permease small subunit
MMRKFLDALYHATGVLAAAFIAVIAVLMIGQSVLREFGVRTGAVNDIVAWCCASGSFFAMAHAFKHGDFVRVTLMLEKMSEDMRRWFELGSLSIAIVSVAYLAYWANLFTYQSFIFDERAQGLLPIPIWIPQASFAISSIVLLVAVIDEWVIVLRGNRPSYVVAVEERHAQGDFSSDV